MDIEYLRDYWVYAQGRSLSKTASIVHSSPSTVSRHLTALEKEMGAPLFDRATGAYTPMGEAILEAAFDIVAAYDRLSERVSSIRMGTEQVLRIAYLPLDNSVVSVVMEARRGAVEQLPSCRIRLIHPTERSLQKMLTLGEADLVISTLSRGLRDGEGFARKRICGGPVYISVRREIGIEGDTVRLSHLPRLTVYRSLLASHRDYCDWAVEMYEDYDAPVSVRYTSAKSMDETLTDDSVDRVLTFTNVTCATSDGGADGNPKRKLYRVLDEVDGAWYVFWRRDSETEELRRLVDMLVEAGGSVGK